MSSCWLLTGPAAVCGLQQCPLLQNQELTAWLADKPLVQVFLPPYSPNLNLMERLRKFLRPKIINTTCYRTKGQFRQAVLDFFYRLDEFEHELASLLTLHFHLVDSQPNS